LACILQISAPLVLIIAGIVKRDRLVELTWPFQKDNLILLCICLIIFLGISAPFLFKLNALTTMTWSNNDIAHYAAVSKFLTQSSFVHPPINVDSWFIATAQRAAHFGAYFSTAIPSSIFSLEPYKIQNLVSNLFYVLSLPIVFLIGIEIFKFKKYMALLIMLLTGISFHLIYINYSGFLGQIFGTGIFLSLFLVTVYPLLYCEKLPNYLPFIPLITVLTLGLILGYSPLLPLFYIPLSLFLVCTFISTKSGSNFFHALSLLLVPFFFAFLLSPFAVFQVFKDIMVYDTILGWEMPPLFPNWAFGIAGININNQNISMQLNPIVDVILSILIVLIAFLSFIHLYKKEQKLFYLSISFISFFVVLYSYLELKELSSFSFTGDSYRAYKLFTYFIPIILLSGLSYFRNFKIGSLTKMSKSHIIGLAFLFLLVLGNIWSASAIILTNYEKSVTIKEDILDLQKITEMDNVTSINIITDSWWNQMWEYYFLFMDKKLYLKYETYHHNSPQVGEWTLQEIKPSDRITIDNTDPNIIKINKGYFLTKNIT
jgi:hypothetical protein